MKKICTRGVFYPFCKYRRNPAQYSATRSRVAEISIWSWRRPSSLIYFLLVILRIPIGLDDSHLTFRSLVFAETDFL